MPHATAKTHATKTKLRAVAPPDARGVSRPRARAASPAARSPAVKAVVKAAEKAAEQAADRSAEAAVAAHAGLRYVSDAKKGITRIRVSRDRKNMKPEAFAYIDADGKRVRDASTLARIKALVLPPAWTDVWICTHANGHLQATGRDAKGRKQYRYHARWREVRDETKYERVIAFGKALPKIRAKVAADMALPGLPRAKVVATVVRLLETTLIRVGNKEYAVKNDSFGLTTMHDEHVDVEGSHLRFHFRGKSGKVHDVDLKDARLAKIVARCQAIEGEELFQYVDEAGERHTIESSDVNAYIHDAAGDEFTAKDFRTFAGTVLFAQAVRVLGVSDTKTRAKKNVVEAIAHVSERLGNTPSVCKKCYVHPVVMTAYLDGVTTAAIEERANRALATGKLPGEGTLKPEEAAVMMLLRTQLAATRKKLGAKQAA